MEPHGIEDRRQSRFEERAGKLEGWRRIFEKRTRSDLTLREFCRRRGITRCQYYWWKRQVQKLGEAGSHRQAKASARLFSALAVWPPKRGNILEYRPASFFVRQHVRGVFACKSCQENVVTAPFNESQPIEKGIPGPGLLAHVLTSKYCDHLPLNRLEGIFSRQGVEVSRSTMCGWVAASYDLERSAKGRPLEERLAIRQERSAAIAERFKLWLEATALAVLPKSPMGQAIEYARSNWPALTRFLETAVLDIDNNAAERNLRPVVIGRKNYLFAGSDAGGERAAVIYSLIASAKHHGVDPFVYPRDILERVSSERASQLSALFPDRWKLTGTKN